MIALTQSNVAVSDTSLFHEAIAALGSLPAWAAWIGAALVAVAIAVAIVAVVALEVALSPSGQSLAMGGLHLLTRLGFGALLGALTGLAIAALLRGLIKATPGL
mgnify:CR=1 FL=1